MSRAGLQGWGTETVRALAGAGAHVTIATRDPAAAKPLLDDFPDTEAVALDLADLGSVHAFCAGWNGPVDAIVAKWSVDPAAADRLWDYALPVAREAVQGTVLALRGMHRNRRIPLRQ